MTSLGFYLGAAPSDTYVCSEVTGFQKSGNNSIDLSLCKCSLELQCACESAREQLKNLLLVSAAQGVFEERPDLWSESCRAIAGMSSCNGLVEELFPDRFSQVISASPSDVSVLDGPSDK